MHGYKDLWMEFRRRGVWYGCEITHRTPIPIRWINLALRHLTGTPDRYYSPPATNGVVRFRFKETER